MKRWFFTTLMLNEDMERVPKVAPYTNPADPTAPRLKLFSNDTEDRCCGLCVLPDMGAVSQDPGVFIFPDVPLGVSWSSIPQADRNEIAAKIRAFGFTFQPHGTMSIREAIELCVHELQPGANIQNIDIFDPYG